MAYITKNTNLLLLALIIVSAIALAIASIYFQNNFEKINNEYNQKLAQLSNVSKQLEQEQAVLTKIRDELSLKSEREVQFTEKYTEIKGEKETLEAEKAGLLQEKARLEADLRDLANQLFAATTDIANKRIEITSLNAQITTLTTDINTYKSKLSSCRAILIGYTNATTC